MMMNLRRSQMMVTDKDYIPFADPVVAQICADNWGDGIGITYKQAAAVTSIGTVFRANTEITSFDELQYFTGVIDFGWYGGGTSADAAFYNCSSLKSIKFPPSLRSISNLTFAGCTQLEIDFGDLPKTVTHIQHAFENCSLCYGVVDLPNLQVLGGFVFKGTGINGAANLGSITTTAQNNSWQGTFTTTTIKYAILPNTLTKIGLGTFANTPSLEAVVIKALTPPTFLGGSPFNETTDIRKIYVPEESVELFKETEGWVNYASTIFAIDEMQDMNPTLYDEIKDFL